MLSIDRDHAPHGGSSVRGLASSVVFLAAFGTLWAMTGIGGLRGLDVGWLSALMIVVGLALLGGGISLIYAARQIANHNANANDSEEHRRNKWFRIIFATELLAIGIAFVVCRAVNRVDMFFPVVVLIVGIHFFPLAALFRVNDYYLAGILLCALAVITLFAIPERLALNDLQIAAWRVTLGFGAAFILWSIGFANWLHGKKLLAQRETARNGL